MENRFVKGAVMKSRVPSHCGMLVFAAVEFASALGCARVDRGFEGREAPSNDDTVAVGGGGDSAGAKTSVSGAIDEPPMHGEVGVEDDEPVSSPAASASTTLPDNGEVTRGIGGTAVTSSSFQTEPGFSEPGTQKACGGRAGDTCLPDEYCAYEAGQLCGAADAQAVCKPRPKQCTREHRPVCGCDGVTYPTACVAASKGVGVLEERECGTLPECEQVQCLRAIECVNTCGGEVVQAGCCPCPAGTLDRDIDCRTPDDAQPCGGSMGATCPDGEYCAFEPGGACGADATAVCRLRPVVCDANYAPVCGCDGKTYSNACQAAAAGQGVAREGDCGK